MTWRNGNVALGLVLGAARLLSGTPASTSDDGQVRSRIEARLASAHFGQPARVEVEVQRGKAVLSGSVPTVHDLWTAERAARKETKKIEDLVTVEPVKAVSDAELSKAITNAVIGYPYYGVFDAVGFDVQDGKVVLTGSVYQPWHKSDIDDGISRIVGMRALTSKIDVQPLSPFDERVRREAYRAIYRNSLFSRYAINPNPPIRILVAHGHLRLAGVVATGLEQTALNVIASQVTSFGRARNEVKVESARPNRTPSHRGIVA
jgi:osmotically-inducible protein OsmY